MRKEPEKENGGPWRFIVFCPLYPPHVGGLENHAEQWNQEMARRGHEVIVWTPHIAGGPSHEERGGIRILRFPAWELISNYPVPKLWHPVFWNQCRSILELLKNKEASEANEATSLPRDEVLRGYKLIIVSRTRFFLTSLMALLVAKVYKVRWLHIEHGSDFVQLTSSPLRFLARLYDYTLGRLALRQADALVANSQASAEFVQKLSDRAVDAVIYRGVDQEKISAIPRTDISKTYKLKTNSSVITYVGRLISSKGIFDLLDACSKLKTESYKLFIIGDGPQRLTLQQQTKQLGIENYVYFLGEKAWEETIALMKASHIIVNPSYTEGLPTSVIESILCRTAVIATNVGGTPEIITHGRSGYLVPSRSPQKIARDVDLLLQRPELRAQVSREAYEAVVYKFSWPKAITQYEGICAAL